MKINESVEDDLVSIVIPTYNCGNFIAETLDSLIAQTHSHWEAIIVDDCSTDNTSDVVENYIQKDARIKYTRLQQNSGAAVARNTAVDLAQGKFIAFLDSDDLWMSTKLEKQIKFMKDNHAHFTCTSYNKIDDHSNELEQVVIAKPLRTYSGLLKENAGNSTVMYNSQEIGKVFIPNIRKRNDYVMWLQVIKRTQHLYGIQEVLASHRIRPGSLSINKQSLVKYHWEVYRNIEKLSLIKSLYLVVYWITIKVFKLR